MGCNLPKHKPQKLMQPCNQNIFSTKLNTKQPKIQQKHTTVIHSISCQIFSFKDYEGRSPLKAMSSSKVTTKPTEHAVLLIVYFLQGYEFTCIIQISPLPTQGTIQIKAQNYLRIDRFRRASIFINSPALHHPYQA